MAILGSGRGRRKARKRRIGSRGARGRAITELLEAFTEAVLEGHFGMHELRVAHARPCQTRIGAAEKKERNKRKEENYKKKKEKSEGIFSN